MKINDSVHAGSPTPAAAPASPGIAPEFTARARPSGRRAGEEGAGPTPAPHGEGGR